MPHDSYCQSAILLTAEQTYVYKSLDVNQFFFSYMLGSMRVGHFLHGYELISP